MYRIGYYLPIIRLGKKSWFYPEGFYCDFLLPTIYSGATVPPKNVFLCRLKVESQRTSYWEHHTGPENIYLPCYREKFT